MSFGKATQTWSKPTLHQFPPPHLAAQTPLRAAAESSAPPWHRRVNSTPEARVDISNLLYVVCLYPPPLRGGLGGVEN